MKGNMCIHTKYTYMHIHRNTHCNMLIMPCTSLGSVYVYSMTGGIWSLTQTLNVFSTNSYFGTALSYSSTGTAFSYSSTGTQFAVGAPYTNSGMYEMYGACI